LAESNGLTKGYSFVLCGIKKCPTGAKGPFIFNIGPDAEEELEEVDPRWDLEVALAKCSISRYGDQTI
jgi:hypothetical protein